MNDESGESTQEDDVIDAGRGNRKTGGWQREREVYSRDSEAHSLCMHPVYYEQVA